MSNPPVIAPPLDTESRPATARPQPPEPRGFAAAARAANTVYRQVDGVDELPRPMTEAELATLGDPMAELLLRRGTFPTTLPALLEGLAEVAGRDVVDGVFLISESGQIPPEVAPGLRRDIRFAIVCTVRGRETDLLISAGANVDPARTFLQVAAWDERAGAFNFYMRSGTTWIWAGDSWAALEPETRGRGCFDSHVNGGVVMKELKQPWINWQSMSASIRLAADAPLRTDPLYQRVEGAEELEIKMRGLVGRWTAARLSRVAGGEAVEHPDRLLRQLLTTTTVNLTSTETASAAVTRDLVLPSGFWLNTDLLINSLHLPAAHRAWPAVPAAHYLRSLTNFGFRLEDPESGFFKSGDTFFAFLVPEVADEDNEVVRQMVRRGLITARFAACALMVDFANPVFSPARAALMRYVPTGTSPAATLGESIATAIVTAAAARPAGSPEAQFAANWALAEDEWKPEFGRRLTTYLDAVADRARTEAGFDDYVRLAESRRLDFRDTRLHEFALTLPVTEIARDAARLQMNADGTVSTRV